MTAPTEINDIEDVMDAILSYFQTNLPAAITALNTKKNNDDYSITNPSSYGLRPEKRGRQNKVIAFYMQRDDVVIDDKSGTMEVNVETTNLGCFVSFYDAATDTDYRKGLRYEKAVKNCLRGLSYRELGVKLIGSQNAPFINIQRDKAVAQGLIVSGAILQATIGG